MTLDLSIADIREEPFHYGLFSSVFSVTAIAALLNWLEKSNAWKLVETDFYEQYEFWVDELSLSEQVKFLASPTILADISAAMRSIFKERSFDEVSIIAHKLLPGQHIGIHNDVTQNGSTHRLTVQLNRGLHNKDGGLFMLFNSDDPSDIHRILKPANNSALAFEVSPRSNHAVSTQRSGVRYTLIFCFNGI